MCPGRPAARRREVGARAARRCRPRAGGTTATDLAVVAERTPDALCLPEEQGGIGEPSAPTAAGSHAALRTVAAHLDGEATLEGLRIGIHGFGQVGSRIAALAAADGAHLLVAVSRTHGVPVHLDRGAALQGAVA